MIAAILRADPDAPCAAAVWVRTTSGLLAVGWVRQTAEGTWIARPRPTTLFPVEVSDPLPSRNAAAAYLLVEGGFARRAAA